MQSGNGDPGHSGRATVVNPLPPVVAALFLVLLGIEVSLYLGAKGVIGGADAVGWRMDAIERFAFSPAVLERMTETGQWPAGYLIRFVSYPFIHTGFMHMLFVGVFLLAMGKMVAEVFGAVSMLLIFVVSSVCGALAYGFLAPEAAPLAGAFPPVYGLIGGFTYLLWRSLGQVGARQSNAFGIIAVLMGIQLLFDLIFNIKPDWVADLAGFLAGFFLSFALPPGGWARFLEKLRQKD